jgi:hypothetical protein
VDIVYAPRRRGRHDNREVDDDALGVVAAMDLNPQKARVR